MSSAQILVERRDRLAWLILNRPQQLNALGRETLRQLDEALADIERDGHIGVLILTGIGERAFAAGADISEMARMDPEEAETFSRTGQRVFHRLERLGKPSIAAINGLALGAGCELAMACSLRVAAETARFGQPEVNLGIIPGWGGTYRLPRLIGRGRALYLILRGEAIDAHEALRIGLVDRVVPAESLREQAEELAHELLQKGPLALAAALQAVIENEGLDPTRAMDRESSLFGQLWKTEDRREGLSAFLEKRRPRFQGS